MSDQEKPWSFTALAKDLNQSKEAVKKAADNGDLKFVEWGGKKFVTPAERRRQRALLAGTLDADDSNPKTAA